MKKILIFLVCFLSTFSALAQKNAIRRQKIDATSSTAQTNGKANRTRITTKKSARPAAAKSSQYYVNLGYDYYNGTGGKRENNSLALSNWKHAAGMGNVEAMGLVGYCYYYV